MPTEEPFGPVQYVATETEFAQGLLHSVHVAGGLAYMVVQFSGQYQNRAFRVDPGSGLTQPDALQQLTTWAKLLKLGLEIWVRVWYRDVTTHVLGMSEVEHHAITVQRWAR